MLQWVSYTPQAVSSNGKYTKAYIYQNGRFKRVRAYIYMDKSKVQSIANQAIANQAIAN